MKCLRLSTLTLLFLLGVGGIAGAVPMIVNSVQHTPGFLPLSLLEHSPFHSYLIPGIILLLANGLLPLWVYLRVRARRPHYGLWTEFQGYVLLGWLIVECVMLRLVAWLHVVYFIWAGVLIVLGWMLRRRQNSVAAHG